MRRPYLHKSAPNYRKTGAKLARCNNINWPLNSLNATYCRVLLCKWWNIGDTYCNQLQNRELPSPCLPICSDCDNICILSQCTIWNQYTCCETSKPVFLRSLIRDVYMLECTVYNAFFFWLYLLVMLNRKKKEMASKMIQWPAAQMVPGMGRRWQTCCHWHTEYTHPLDTLLGILFHLLFYAVL